LGLKNLKTNIHSIKKKRKQKQRIKKSEKKIKAINDFFFFS